MRARPFAFASPFPPSVSLDAFNGLADGHHEGLAIGYVPLAPLFGVYQLTVDDHLELPGDAWGLFHVYLGVGVVLLDQPSSVPRPGVVASRAAVLDDHADHSTFVGVHVEIPVD